MHENATTNHSAYHIAVDRRNQKKAKKPRNKHLQGLSQSQTRIFSSKVRSALEDNTPVTFIDEVSLMTAITLGHVIQRYREIKGLIIGPFILVGDFYQVLLTLLLNLSVLVLLCLSQTNSCCLQIAPVGGTTIYSTMMHWDHKRFNTDYADHVQTTQRE